MTEVSEYIISCDADSRLNKARQNYLELAYKTQCKRNVSLLFDDSFKLNDLDDRIQDLIEIAGYIYSAEIKSSLEQSDETEAANKLFSFYIGVRDYNFWKQSEIKTLLDALLHFLTGNNYNFIFSKINQSTTNNRRSRKSPKEKRLVTFLSGGIDSTAGVVDLLEKNPDGKICMVMTSAGPAGDYFNSEQFVHKDFRTLPGKMFSYKIPRRFNKGSFLLKKLSYKGTPLWCGFIRSDPALFPGSLLRL